MNNIISSHNFEKHHIISVEYSQKSLKSLDSIFGEVDNNDEKEYLDSLFYILKGIKERDGQLADVFFDESCFVIFNKKRITLILDKQSKRYKPIHKLIFEQFEFEKPKE